MYNKSSFSDNTLEHQKELNLMRLLQKSFAKILWNFKADCDKSPLTSFLELCDTEKMNTNYL